MPQRSIRSGATLQPLGTSCSCTKRCRACGRHWSALARGGKPNALPNIDDLTCPLEELRHDRSPLCGPCRRGEVHNEIERTAHNRTPGQTIAHRSPSQSTTSDSTKHHQGLMGQPRICEAAGTCDSRPPSCQGAASPQGGRPRCRRGLEQSHLGRQATASGSARGRGPCTKKRRSRSWAPLLRSIRQLDRTNDVAGEDEEGLAIRAELLGVAPRPGRQPDPTWRTSAGARAPGRLSLKAVGRCSAADRRRAVDRPSIAHSASYTMFVTCSQSTKPRCSSTTVRGANAKKRSLAWPWGESLQVERLPGRKEDTETRMQAHVEAQPTAALLSRFLTRHRHNHFEAHLEPMLCERAGASEQDAHAGADSLKQALAGLPSPAPRRRAGQTTKLSDRLNPSDDVAAQGGKQPHRSAHAPAVNKPRQAPRHENSTRSDALDW